MGEEGAIEKLSTTLFDLFCETDLKDSQRKPQPQRRPTCPELQRLKALRCPFATVAPLPCAPDLQQVQALRHPDGVAHVGHMEGGHHCRAGPGQAQELTAKRGLPL